MCMTTATASWGGGFENENDSVVLLSWTMRCRRSLGLLISKGRKYCADAGFLLQIRLRDEFRGRGTFDDSSFCGPILVVCLFSFSSMISAISVDYLVVLEALFPFKPGFLLLPVFSLHRQSLYASTPPSSLVLPTSTLLNVGSYSFSENGLLGESWLAYPFTHLSASEPPYRSEERDNCHCSDLLPQYSIPLFLFPRHSSLTSKKLLTVRVLHVSCVHETVSCIPRSRVIRWLGIPQTTRSPRTHCPSFLWRKTSLVFGCTRAARALQPPFPPRGCGSPLRVHIYINQTPYVISRADVEIMSECNHPSPEPPPRN